MYLNETPAAKERYLEEYGPDGPRAESYPASRDEAEAVAEAKRNGTITDAIYAATNDYPGEFPSDLGALGVFTGYLAATYDATGALGPAAVASALRAARAYEAGAYGL